MSKKKINVGLIGYQFMGKAHSNAYRQVGRFFDLSVDVHMHTICGRNEAAVKQAAEGLTASLAAVRQGTQPHLDGQAWLHDAFGVTFRV